MNTQRIPRTFIAATGVDRRSTPRHDAASLGPIAARLVGGDAVRLLDFSRHGILLESAARLLIGVRATIRLVTLDAAITVHGRVVRSKVAKTAPNGLVYHTALAVDEDLSGLEAAAMERRDTWQEEAAPAAHVMNGAPGSERAKGGTTVMLNDETADLVLEFMATVPHNLEELRRRAAVNDW